MRVLLLAGTGLAVAACLWGAVGSPPGWVAPLAWAGVLWLPGAWIALSRSLPSRGRFDALCLPLGLGPVLFGAGITAGLLAGLPLAPAAFLTVAISSAGLVHRLTRGGSRPDPQTSPPSAPDRAGLVLLGVGAILFLIGVLPGLLHEALRFRDDARLHLPVVERILQGSFPPENPFLAGEPLGYFWFYHATLAGVTRLTHFSPDWVPTLFNAQALLFFLMAVTRAARGLRLNPPARVAALTLAVLGLAPWGWLRMVTLLVFRPDLNWPLIRASGVSAVFPLLCPADPRLAAFLTKIAFSNALPMSLALALWAAFPDPREGKRSEFVLGALVAGCLGFHLATGLLLLAGLLTRWGVERVLALRGNRTANAVPMRPLLFAMVLAAPYAISVMSARESPAATWTWQGSRSLELHLALIGIWILTLPVWREWLGRPDTRAWILTGVPALVLPFVVHLVDGNEYKSLFFLLGILALPAAAGLARITRERRAWVALILLVFLPTSVITAWICGTEIPPGHLDSAERHRVSEMTRDLPVESVIWIPDPARAYETLTVFLGKPCYLSDPYPLQIMGQWDGEEARWRRASLALAGTRETVPRALASAQSRVPRRPLYALVTSETARRYPHLIPALEALRLEAIPGEGFQLYPIPSPEEPPKTP